MAFILTLFIFYIYIKDSSWLIAAVGQWNLANKWWVKIENLAETKALLLSPPFATFLYNWRSGPLNNQVYTIIIIPVNIPHYPLFLVPTFFCLFVCPASVVCSVCFGLLYDRSSDFISCNKYFNIIARVTTGFFTDTVRFVWLTLMQS